MRASAAVGAAATQIAFTRPEEKLGFLTLRSGSKLGAGKIRVIATSGKFRAESDVWLEVRTPNVPSSRFQRATLAPGASWKGDAHGLRPRRHAGGKPGSLGAAAHQPRWPPRISHPLSVRLPRADHLERLSAALSTGADQARPEPPARGGEQHPRRPRAPAQPAASERRIRVLAGHVEHRSATRLAQQLGHDLRRPLLPRGREGRIHAARRHEVRLAALSEEMPRSTGIRARTNRATMRPTSAMPSVMRRPIACTRWRSPVSPRSAR